MFKVLDSKGTTYSVQVSMLSAWCFLDVDIVEKDMLMYVAIVMYLNHVIRNQSRLFWACVWFCFVWFLFLMEYQP